MQNNCNLCLEVLGSTNFTLNRKYVATIADKKHLLLTTENFAVVPSIGPLNESHVLILPKTHVRSFAELSDQRLFEVAGLLEKIKQYGKLTNGKEFIFFEHGTGSQSDTAGGCIEHAHLHAIWNAPKISEEFQKKLGLTKVPSSIPINQIGDNANGYAYFQDCDGTVFLKNNPKIPSQYFRQLYAKTLDSQTVWNWRNHMNAKGIQKVIEYYSDLTT